MGLTGLGVTTPERLRVDGVYTWNSKSRSESAGVPGRATGDSGDDDLMAGRANVKGKKMRMRIMDIRFVRDAGDDELK